VAVLGVDGWRGAWVGALLEGRTVTLLSLPDAAAVLAVPGVEVVGVDMPIGLADDGPRACDVAARRLLGRAGSSVLPASLRPVLGCGSYEEACAVSRAVSGKALSLQARNLVPSIRTLDDALGDPPDGRVAEVHPELVPAVDCLDACAAAVAARRVADGSAQCVGDGARGRPMTICW